MKAETLSGGFADPATHSAFAFRGIMTAMARPGRICDISGATGPAPLSPAAATALLTLCDDTTALHLTPSVDSDALRRWLAFHTGAPLAKAEQADFALGTWEELVPLSRFRIGSPEYPDRSATLIVELPELTGQGAELRGPGIQTTAQLSLPETTAFQENARQFPLGLDFFFTSGSRISALPRSTEVR